MKEYKITKFDPQNRLEGIYAVHEWTSISDVGKVFDSGVLTYQQYVQVEQNYIDCCIELLQKSNIPELFVCSPEYYDKGLRFPSILYSENEIRRVIMLCLREKCWVKLESDNFYIHFGYDYNMYIGTNLSAICVQEIAKTHNLFCEEKASPYCSQDMDDV